MWARIAAFEGGNDEELRRRNEERGGMDMPPGMTGGMVMRGGGKRLFVAYFDDEQSLDAAAQHFEKMGDDIPEDVRGKRTSVDKYEVVWNSWEQS